MRKIYRAAISIFGFFILSCSVGRAANVSINITGSITAPTCVINNGKTIEVKFGDIPAADISNVKYNMLVVVPVYCEYNTGVPYIKVIASSLGSDGNVVATSTPHFGIALFQGSNLNAKLMLGEGTSSGGKSYGYRMEWGLEGNGATNGTLSFTAVPYKLGSSELAAGPFSANATMSFNYL